MSVVCYCCCEVFSDTLYGAVVMVSPERGPSFSCAGEPPEYDWMCDDCLCRHDEPEEFWIC
jgi:hypothetical protein